MVKHELASSAYNERRAQCEEGVRVLARDYPNVKALRDVTIEQLEEHRSELSEVVYRRCRHVITENARVIEAGEALEDHDLDRFGKLMAESHVSLRDDYEVSADELDLMVELAAQLEGVYGARMTGGGFGGSTVNLVREEKAEEFRARVAEGYEQMMKRKPEIYICSAGNGAEEVR
jgi:galactokinase